MGAHMGITTTAGISKSSVSYSTIPKTGANRNTLVPSMGGLIPPQTPLPTSVSTTFQGEGGHLIETE